MSRLSKWIDEKSTGKITLFTFIIFMVFTATVLPAQAKKSEAYSNGASSVDLSLIYSTEDVYQMAESYGEEGRTGYIRSAFTFDVVWPIIYMLFLCAAIAYFGQKVLNAGSKFLLLNLTPLIGLILDYVENSLASLTFYLFPDRIPLITGLLPPATFLKWVFVGGASLLVLLYLLAWGIKVITNKK